MSFQLKSKLTGKCLTAHKDLQSFGTEECDKNNLYQIWNQNGPRIELENFKATDGKKKLCMDIYSVDDPEPSLWECDPSYSNQEMIFDGNGHIGHDGYYLTEDVTARKNDNDHDQVRWIRNDISNSTQWQKQNLQNSQNLPNLRNDVGNYNYIRSRFNNQCVTSTGSRKPLDMQECSSTNQNQQWYRQDDSIRLLHPPPVPTTESKFPASLCWDIYDPSYPTPYGWHCNGSPQQNFQVSGDQWKQIQYDNRYHLITNHKNTIPSWQLNDRSQLHPQQGEGQRQFQSEWEFIDSSQLNKKEAKLGSKSALLSSAPASAPNRKHFIIPQYWNTKPSTGPSRRLYYKDFDNYIKANREQLQNDLPTSQWFNQLKQKTKSNLIVSTFNVHYWTDVNERWNFENILNTIKNMNSSILMLQEVSRGCNTFCQEAYPTSGKITDLPEYVKNDSKIFDGIQRVGNYNEYSFCRTTKFYDKEFGNAIFVRAPYRIVSQSSIQLNYPHDNVGQDGLPEERCLTRLVIELPNKKSQIAIYNLHMDVFDETGTTRLASAEKIVRDLLASEPLLVIMAGDFNNTYAEDYPSDVWNWMNRMDRGRLSELATTGIPTESMDYLRKPPIASSPVRNLFPNLPSNTPLFSTSFELSGKPHVPATTWSERAVDYILFDYKWIVKGLQDVIIDSWTEWDNSSDHLPLSVAIDVDLLQQKLLLQK